MTKADFMARKALANKDNHEAFLDDLSNANDFPGAIISSEVKVRADRIIQRERAYEWWVFLPRTTKQKIIKQIGVRPSTITDFTMLYCMDITL